MIDVFLESLLRTIEKVGGGLEVTLNVNGTVVSGVLMSEEEYITQQALRITRIRQPEEEKPTEPNEEDIVTIRRFFGWAPRNEEEPVRYVHLKDVTIHLDTATGNIQGDLWRGRAESIDGFLLGRPTED